MTHRSIPWPGHRRAIAPVRVGKALVAVALTAILASCTSTTPATPATPPIADAPPTAPLVSAYAGPTATWAVVAMGHLDDPLNTFWQLLALPLGSATWSLATPPGVASNGGLVTAVDPSGTVTAGFEPSLDLRFSPLAQSTDGGGSWVPGVLPGGLDLAPDALASSGTGRYLALLRNRQDEVVANGGDLATWTTVVTLSTLSADRALSRCGIESLTAVTIAADGSDEVGGSCSTGNEIGILASDAGAWKPVGPSLTGNPVGPTQVLRLVATPAGTAALVSVGRGGSRRLLALWSGSGLGNWSVSAPLPLPRASIVSTATGPDGSLVVNTATASGRLSAWSIGPTTGTTHSAWQQLATPPAGTSAVVVTPSGQLDAFIVHQSTLDVDTLVSAGWQHTQTLEVAIQYGSSG